MMTIMTQWSVFKQDCSKLPENHPIYKLIEEEKGGFSLAGLEEKKQICADENWDLAPLLARIYKITCALTDSKVELENWKRFLRSIEEKKISIYSRKYEKHKDGPDVGVLHFPVSKKILDGGALKVGEWERLDPNDAETMSRITPQIYEILKQAVNATPPRETFDSSLKWPDTHFYTMEGENKCGKVVLAFARCRLLHLSENRTLFQCLGLARRPEYSGCGVGATFINKMREVVAWLKPDFFGITAHLDSPGGQHLLSMGKISFEEGEMITSGNTSGYHFFAVPVKPEEGKTKPSSSEYVRVLKESAEELAKKY